MADFWSLAPHPTKAELARLPALPSEPPEEPCALYRFLRRKQNLALTQSLAAQQLSPSPFDGGALASALFSAAREVCPFPPQNLRLVPARQPLPILAPPDAFSSVLLGLLCNSFLYGGNPPQIQLRLFSAGRQAVFELRDLGPGLPRELHAPHGGGIVLARLFARAFGGCFLLDSPPQKGVRALLSLPLCDARQLTPTPSADSLLKDPFSSVFVQLSPRCILPDS